MAALLRSALTGAGLWAAGDASCQVLVPKLTDTPTAPYDYERTARQALFGGVFMSTVGGQFYGGIEKLMPGTSMGNAVGKVAADQILFAPVLLSSLFYSMARMEGETHEVGAERVTGNLFGALQANWTVWPAVQAINLTMVPVAHRLTVVNAVCIPWTGEHHSPRRKHARGPAASPVPRPCVMLTWRARVCAQHTLPTRTTSRPRRRRTPSECDSEARAAGASPRLTPRRIPAHPLPRCTANSRLDSRPRATPRRLSPELTAHSALSLGPGVAGCRRGGRGCAWGKTAGWSAAWGAKTGEWRGWQRARRAAGA